MHLSNIKLSDSRDRSYFVVYCGISSSKTKTINIHTSSKSKKRMPQFYCCQPCMPHKSVKMWMPISPSSLPQNTVTKSFSTAMNTKALKILAIRRTPSLPSFTNALSKIINPPLHPSVDPSHVFSENFAPVDELEPTDCPVEGQLPACLSGVYLRNGPNPQHKNSGPLHLFEGDGMIHSLRLIQGHATYCCRYVKTYKFMLEREAGCPVFPNVLSGFYGLSQFLQFAGVLRRVISGRLNLMRGFGAANTSLSFFANRIVALGENDLPYTIHLTEDGDIETLGRWEFDNKFLASMTAHPKIDPSTKEVFAFRFSPTSFPHITYFRFNEKGIKTEDVPLLSVKQPSFTHDLAITNRFAIFHESQLLFKLSRVITGKGMPVVFDEAKMPRIGLLPRYAISDSEMMWFPAPGFNAFHIINAWDNGEDEVVLVSPNAVNMQHVAFQRMEEASFPLEKVTINLKTGQVSRAILSERNLEVGCINPSYTGKRNRYAYLAIMEKITKMSGIVKVDLENRCEVSKRLYEPGSYGGEPCFIARDNANGGEEDDGFLVTYVYDENSGKSRLVVMDAMSPELQVVATVKVPGRVPYGFHGLFIGEKDLSNLS